jgi:hypothetical protein
MPKAKKPTTKAVSKSTATKRTRPPAPDEFFPMPASEEGWLQCKRITRIAFAVLDSAPDLLSDPTLSKFADRFADVSLALKKMSLLCSGAHARIVAASIRVGRRGAKAKPAAVKQRKAVTHIKQ